jgi:hypothetical protein
MVQRAPPARQLMMDGLGGLSVLATRCFSSAGGQSKSQVSQARLSSQRYTHPTCRSSVALSAVVQPSVLSPAVFEAWPARRRGGRTHPAPQGLLVRLTSTHRACGAACDSKPAGQLRGDARTCRADAARVVRTLGRRRSCLCHTAAAAKRRRGTTCRQTDRSRAAREAVAGRTHNIPLACLTVRPLP